MGASLWGQVGLPLLSGVASSIVFAALCFLSARLWNCLIKQIKIQTADGESAHDQPLPDNDAAAPGNVVPDLEMGNGYGPAQGTEFMAEPGLEMGILNGGKGIEHFCEQEAPHSSLKAQVIEDAARGALVHDEMDVLHSQQEEVS